MASFFSEHDELVRFQGNLAIAKDVRNASAANVHDFNKIVRVGGEAAKPRMWTHTDRRGRFSKRQIGDVSALDDKASRFRVQGAMRAVFLNQNILLFLGDLGELL